MHRQRIDQFVGKEATHGNARRNLGRSGKAPGGHMALRATRGLFAARGTALHGDVAQGIIKCRELGLAKIENVDSASSHARARLNEHEFRRTAEVLPHLNKLPGKETAKDGMHVDACVVVRETLGFSLAVIPLDRMVKALAHIVREREGAKAANAVGKQFSEWRHAPMAPAESPAGSAWIFLQARSKTPCAASSKSTK